MVNKEPVALKSTPVSTDGVPSKKPVAIFDIDGTIFRSSLLIKLVEELIRRGDFPADAKKVYEEHEAAWIKRSGSYEDYIMGVVNAFTSHIKGMPCASLYGAAKTVNEKEKDLLYRYTPRLVKELKEKGYYLLAVSQSPWAVLEEFCKSLGFDKVYGRFYEQDEAGNLTGTVKDEELISDKATIIRRAVEKNDLTLVGSVGVGDTEGDITMLSMVERPICFNPNFKLITVAKEKGWDVVIERKDVIFEWIGKTGGIHISQ